MLAQIATYPGALRSLRVHVRDACSVGKLEDFTQEAVE